MKFVIVRMHKNITFSSTGSVTPEKLFVTVWRIRFESARNIWVSPNKSYHVSFHQLGYKTNSYYPMWSMYSCKFVLTPFFMCGTDLRRSPLCFFFCKPFKDTFENIQRRKVKPMQPKWLCIYSSRRFEETFEDTQWREVKQMQPVWLCMLSRKQFEETFENT